jgi:predicted nucleic acid-binding Zn ribbon protein
MAIKKCQICGTIISSGEICEKCETETLQKGSSKKLFSSLLAGVIVLVVVLAGLKLSGRI